jgi:lysophospholipase L1-like esterase
MSGRRMLSIRRGAVLLAVVLVIGLVMGAQPLRKQAGDLSSPALRAVARAVTAPFGAVNGLLHIEGARQRVVSAFGGGDQVEAGGGGDNAVASNGSGGPPAGPPPSQPPTGSVLVTAGGPAGPGSTSPPGVKPVFDKDHPLRVLVEGDSLVGPVGASLTRMADDLPMQVLYRFKGSSGLVNTGFFDWQAETKTRLAQFKPDVTVLMFGNNDRQDMIIDGKRPAIFSPDWTAEYRKRVLAMGDIVRSGGSRLVFIGMPIMRSDKFSLTARNFNQIFSEVCADQGYWFVDTYKLFADASGSYAPYLDDTNGTMASMRMPDGIHFTPAGGDRAARQVMRTLQAHFTLQN